MKCPLCLKSDLVEFSRANQRFYNLCNNCALISLASEFHLDLADEKKQYLSHENCRENKGYVEFLLKLITPLISLIDIDDRGLDFGSGPTPVAAQLLSELGYQTDTFDPFFSNDGACLSRKYDFVISTEVVEHFYEPRKEFDCIDGLLNEGSYFGVMSLLYEPSIDFDSWWYPRDPTHCVFYQDETLNYLEKQYNWSIIYSDRSRVFIFKKERFKS